MKTTITTIALITLFATIIATTSLAAGNGNVVTNPIADNAVVKFRPGEVYPAVSMRGVRVNEHFYTIEDNTPKHRSFYTVIEDRGEEIFVELSIRREASSKKDACPSGARFSLLRYFFERERAVKILVRKALKEESQRSIFFRKKSVPVTGNRKVVVRNPKPIKNTRGEVFQNGDNCYVWWTSPKDNYEIIQDFGSFGVLARFKKGKGEDIVRNPKPIKNTRGEVFQDGDNRHVWGTSPNDREIAQGFRSFGFFVRFKKGKREDILLDNQCPTGAVLLLPRYVVEENK